MEELNYQALIEDLEDKRRTFNRRTDEMIAHLRLLLSMAGIPTTESASQAPQADIAGDVPRTAFSDMKVQEAVIAFLRLTKRKASTTAIVDGLRKGGIHSASKNLYSNVYTALVRLETSGEVVKMQKEWGLKDWYPTLRGRKQQAKNGTADKAGTQFEPGSPHETNGPDK